MYEAQEILQLPKR